MMASRGLADEAQSELQEVVAAFYAEFADPNSGGVTFNRWCHLLQHHKLFSNEFDHDRALDAFDLVARLSDDGPAKILDKQGFRNCLDSLASATYGGGRQTWQQLERLLSDISLRRDAPFDPSRVGDFQGLLYEPELIKFVYRSYSGILHALFTHYADNSRGTPEILGRSVYRLCRALNLVPTCLVPGELSDLAGSFLPESRNVMERRYFDDERMIAGGDDQDWVHAHRNAQPGEPRYSFPELVELLVCVVLCMLPRVHYGTPNERLERLEEVLQTYLRLPPDAHGLDVKKFLRDRCGGAVKRQSTVQKIGLDLNRLSSLEAVFDALDDELAELPPPQKEVQLPKPPPGKELVQQPQTVDEKLEEEEVARKAAAAKAQSKRGSILNQVPAKAPGPLLRRRKVVTQKAWSGRGEVPFGEACWYGKRPQEAELLIPQQFQIQRRADQLELLERNLEEHARKMNGLAGPVTGWVLRMALIHEPLRAPPCSESDEVSTLIETALTSRRLRNYDIAISLLIRARRLWAALVAGRNVPSAWADVQPVVLVASPWATLETMATPWPQAGVGDQLCAAGSPSPEPASAFDQTISPGDLRRDAADVKAPPSEVGDAVKANASPLSPSPPLPALAVGSSVQELGNWLGDMKERRNYDENRQRMKQEAQIRDQARERAREQDAESREKARLREQAYSHNPAAAMSATAMSAREPRQPSQGSRAATPRQGSYTPRQGSHALPGALPGLGVTAGCTDRVYDPQLHFDTACGNDDENIRHLADEINIFFLCELASLHSAIHEDQLAGRLLWCARPFSDSLPTNHPDTAVVWSGLGRVAFHSGNCELGARSLARARNIREKTIGEDTVETATTYNNLACCMAGLGRTMESFALIQLAAELLKILLGEDHPRTQTARRNLEKSRTFDKHLQCEIPNLYGIPVEDKFKLGRKGKKKKKRGKSGSSRGGSDGGESSGRRSSGGSQKGNQKRGQAGSPRGKKKKGKK